MAEIHDICEELQVAALLCDDEIGEWWLALASLYPRVIDFGSPEMVDIWEREVRSDYNHFKRNYAIVERTEQRTVTRREIVFREGN